MQGKREISPQAVFKLNPEDQQVYLKIKVGTKSQYIDAYIYVKSAKEGYTAMKRSSLPFLKDKQMFMDEYALHSLDGMQVRWLFGKDSFIATIEIRKKWIDSLFGEAHAQRLVFLIRNLFLIRNQGIKYAKFGIEVKSNLHIWN